MYSSNINIAIACTLSIFLSTYNAFSQDKYLDKNGKIKFEASQQTFEPVEAKNESVTAILNVATGEFAALALAKGFRFKNSLMEEHFNENYIESDDYPKMVFKGKLIDFKLSSLSENETTLELKGKLQLHGKEKEVEVPLVLSEQNGVIHLSGEFSITPEEFNISIPKIVSDKIAKKVSVQFNFNLKTK